MAHTIISMTCLCGRFLENKPPCLHVYVHDGESYMDIYNFHYQYVVSEIYRIICFYVIFVIPVYLDYYQIYNMKMYVIVLLIVNCILPTIHIKSPSFGDLFSIFLISNTYYFNLEIDENVRYSDEEDEIVEMIRNGSQVNLRYYLLNYYHKYEEWSRYFRFP